jgi:hypothetical protein
VAFDRAEGSRCRSRDQCRGARWDDNADLLKLGSGALLLRRVILPMREVVNGVQRHHADDAAHPGDLDGWYADLYDHVVRASE